MGRPALAWATALLAFGFGVAAVGARPADGQGRGAAIPSSQSGLGPGLAGPPKGSGLIVGQVVDGVTAKGVGGAVVTMVMTSAQPAMPAAGRGGQNSTASLRVLTDGSGRFVFHDLPKGTATLTATLPGYSPGAYGQHRPVGASRPLVLDDGQRVGDAIIPVWKLATISGSVVDESGEPLVGVPVVALRFVKVNGRRRTASGPQTTTDDRGMFHFVMNSGEFLVAVPTTASSAPLSTVEAYRQAITAPNATASDLMRNLSASGGNPPSLTGTRIGSMQLQPSGAIGRWAPGAMPGTPIELYQTTYYPASVTPTQAQTIELGPGDDRSGVNLTMRLTSTSQVSGVLISPDGAAGSLGVRLTLAEDQDATFDERYPVATTISDASGAFTFLGVPAGQYVLSVTKIPRPDMVSVNGVISQAPTTTSPTLWARVPVTVSTRDVGDLTVPLRPGVHLSGRIEFDGSSPKPERATNVVITLTDLDGQAQTIAPTRLGVDGQFATQGVIPGHYLVASSTPGANWTLKSIVADGHDLSASPQMIESDLSSVVVTFTDRPTRLDGTVAMPTAAAAPLPLIVIFPSAYQAWLDGGAIGRSSRSLTPDAAGRFTVSTLPIGDYCVAAIPADFDGDWQDPKTIEIIARGATRVTFGDGEHRTVDLRPLVLR